MGGGVGVGRDGKLDAHFDVCREGYAGRLDVIAGPTGRRQRSTKEKARIAAESLLPGVRVADVARRHGVTRWQVYDWRRRARGGRLALMDETAAFAAVIVEETPTLAAADAAIEIMIGDVVIRVGRDADESRLSRVIRAVRAAL